MSQSIDLQTRQVGPWGMNSYALICTETNESVLIDPGGDPEKLMGMLGDSKPVAILLTHSHVDHVMALDEMREKLNVPVVAHGGDHAEPITADIWLEDGQTFGFGNQMLDVVHTLGHIGDQICFLPRGDMRYIVGDTIFEGGPGRTWSVEGFAETLRTLKNIVLPWDDNVVCYPGHGNAFRLGDIRPDVEAFVARDHGDFFGDAEWGQKISDEK